MRSHVNAEVMTEKLHVCTGGLLFISTNPHQSLHIHHGCSADSQKDCFPYCSRGKHDPVCHGHVSLLKGWSGGLLSHQGLRGEGFVCFTHASGKFLAGLKLILSFVFMLIKSFHLDTNTSCSLFTTVYSKPKQF